MPGEWVNDFQPAGGAAPAQAAQRQYGAITPAAPKPPMAAQQPQPMGAPPMGQPPPRPMGRAMGRMGRQQQQPIPGMQPQGGGGGRWWQGMGGGAPGGPVRPPLGAPPPMGGAPPAPASPPAGGAPPPAGGSLQAGNPGGEGDAWRNQMQQTARDLNAQQPGGGQSSIRAIEPGNMRERAAEMEQMYSRRSQPMGPPPPTGVASLGVGPVGNDRMMAAAQQQYGAAGGGTGVGTIAGGVPSEAGEYDRQLSQVDSARAAADQQQQAADQPAPPPPQPQSSIQAMEGGGMDRSRLMQEMQGRRQQMQRRPYGRGRGPGTY